MRTKEKEEVALVIFDEHGVYEIRSPQLLSLIDGTVPGGGGLINYFVCAEVGEVNAGCRNSYCLNGGCDNEDCINVDSNPGCVNGTC